VYEVVEVTVETQILFKSAAEEFLSLQRLAILEGEEAKVS